MGLWDLGPLLSGLLQRLAHCPAVFFALFAFPQRGRCAIYDSRSHRDLRHRNRGVFDIPMGPCHLTPDPQNEGNRQLLSSYVVLRDVPFGNQTWQWEIPHTWRFWKNYLPTYLPTYLSLCLSIYLSSYPFLSCPILSIYLSTTFVYIYVCVCPLPRLITGGPEGTILFLHMNTRIPKGPMFKKYRSNLQTFN